MNRHLTAKTAAAALAAFVTLAVFGGVDSLAYEQHAAVQMAKAASAAATTAMAKGTPAKRS